MFTPVVAITPKELDKLVSSVAAEFPGDVVRIRYVIDYDWMDVPSITFMTLMTDRAANSARSHTVARAVAARLEKEVGVYDQELPLYFRVRTESEQAELRSPAWE